MSDPTMTVELTEWFTMSFTQLVDEYPGEWDRYQQKHPDQAVAEAREGFARESAQIFAETAVKHGLRSDDRAYRQVDWRVSNGDEVVAASRQDGDRDE